MTRAEVYKKILKPPDGWDKDQADLYQIELRRQGKYRNTKLPASFPFYKFDGDVDDKVKERGDLIVRLMGKRNPFSLEKWKDLLDDEPPQRQKVVSVKSVTLPRANKPLMDIKTDTKSFQEAQYDADKLILWLKLKIVVDDDGRKVHLGIFRAAKRVLNELAMKDAKIKRDVYLEIQAGVKSYLSRGLPSKYVNEYTFARVLKNHPELVDGVISPNAYPEFHPDASLPTGYKTWRKWAIAMKKKYLRWLNNPKTIQTDDANAPIVQLTANNIPKVQVKPVIPVVQAPVQQVPTLADELQKVQLRSQTPTPPEPVATTSAIQPMRLVGSGSGTSILICENNEKCNIVIHDAGPGSAYSEKEDYREFIRALGVAGDISQLDALELKEKDKDFTYEKLGGKDVIKIPTNGFDMFYENLGGVMKNNILVQRLISRTDLLKWIKDQHFTLDTEDADGDDDNEDITGENYQKLDEALLNNFLNDAKTALSQYHKLGGNTLFLHRDIKADNIVISDTNDLYLFDYDMTLNVTKNAGSIVQAIYNGDAARWDYRNQPENDPGDDDAAFTTLVSPALDYFQMGITLLNLGGKFDVSDDFGLMENSVIKFKGNPQGLPVVGFLNGKNEELLNENTKNGKMTKARLDKFIKALRDPVADGNNLPKQLNLPTSILKRIGNEFLRTYDEMVECAEQQKMIDIQVASTDGASQVRTTFLDYDSMSDMELNELGAELDEFTDDELEHMLEEVNVGQGKDDYDSMSDSAPTSIAGRSYDSSSDLTEESYNSSSDAAHESYNSSSDMADEYDSISEVSASYNSESDEDN